MAARGVLRTIQGNQLGFWCPGCNEAHVIAIGTGTGPRWTFNDNYDRPTFTPSILVRGVRIDGGDAELDRILETYKLPEDRERILADKRVNTICHSFVRDGQIEFLGDSTHALAGQTVPLKPFDADN